MHLTPRPLTPLSPCADAGSQGAPQATTPSPFRIPPFSSLQLGVLAEDVLEPLLDFYGHTGISMRCAYLPVVSYMSVVA